MCMQLACKNNHSRELERMPLKRIGKIPKEKVGLHKDVISGSDRIGVTTEDVG